MKVIEADFSKNPTCTLLEGLTKALEHIELGDHKGAKFFLVIDTDDQTSFVTNEQERPNAAFMLYQAHLTVMGAL